VLALPEMLLLFWVAPWGEPQPDPAAPVAK
jgi:hypothetical protein